MSAEDDRDPLVDSFRTVIRARAAELVDVDDRTPVQHDPRGHSFEPFRGEQISNATPGASCRHCGRERPEHPTVKCHTESCADNATVRAYWPGNPCDFCATCTLRAVNVAAAMGFVLSVAPLKVGT